MQGSTHALTQKVKATSKVQQLHSKRTLLKCSKFDTRSKPVAPGHKRLRPSHGHWWHENVRPFNFHPIKRKSTLHTLPGAEMRTKRDDPSALNDKPSWHVHCKQQDRHHKPQLHFLQTTNCWSSKLICCTKNLLFVKRPKLLSHKQVEMSSTKSWFLLSLFEIIRFQSFDRLLISPVQGCSFEL